MAGGETVLFTQKYPEGLFKPEKSSTQNIWCVWCKTGALEVLNSDEFMEEVMSGRPAMILCANGSYIESHPDEKMWEQMAELATVAKKTEAFPRKLYTFVHWSGAPDDINEFDAIRFNYVE